MHIFELSTRGTKMSSNNDEVSENQILMEQFIQSWVRYTIDHPQVTLGEWLKTISIMTGLAMKVGNMPSDLVPNALEQMRVVVTDVYNKSDAHVQMATTH